LTGLDKVKALIVAFYTSPKGHRYCAVHYSRILFWNSLWYI